MDRFKGFLRNFAGWFASFEGFCKTGVAAFGRNPHLSISRVYGALPGRRYDAWEFFGGFIVEVLIVPNSKCS